jgi:hypothetical protein
MKVFVAVCLVAVLACLPAFAQEGAKTTLKGYVVDQMCGKGMVKKENIEQKAPGHTKECALEDACAASGFGIYSQGKYYTFDEKGSGLAKAAIEKGSRDKGLYFEATGVVKGDMLAVSSLKEAAPGKDGKMMKKEMKKESKDEEKTEEQSAEETED